MRSLLIWMAVLLLGGAALIELVDSDPGYVLISIWQTRIELSFWLAVLILLASGSVVVLVVGVVRSSLQSTNSLLGRIFNGSARRSAKRTSQGLLDFLEGNWKKSRKNLLKGVKKSDMPLVNYLAAARSSYELGEQEQTQALLHQAEQCSPSSELAVGLTQARMQMADKKYEQCVGTLERVKRIAPDHPVLLDLLCQVYEIIQDWKKLLELLPDLKRKKVLDSEALDKLECRIYHANICEAKDLERARLYWKSLPSSLKKDLELVKAYAVRLQDLGVEDDSEELVRSTLSKRWDDSLVRFYGVVKGKDKARQLLFAETWLKERPGNAVLLLSLGRLCLRNELWGKARKYFESSLQLQKDPQTYAELARLLAHLNEHKLSTEYYQQGLLMTTDGLPELPLP